LSIFGNSIALIGWDPEKQNNTTQSYFSYADITLGNSMEVTNMDYIITFSLTVGAGIATFILIETIKKIIWRQR